MAAGLILFKMNLVPRKECRPTFCNEQIKTAKHLLCDCTHVKHMWVRLEHWIYTGTGNKLTFSLQDKLCIELYTDCGAWCIIAK